MTIEICDGSLVLLIGASGSGKSSFARRNFLPTEVISSDRCRALISDDEADQSVSREAFEIVHLIAAKRLGIRRTTVIDATNVTPDARRSLIALARADNRPAVAIVFDLPLALLLQQNAARPGRVVDPRVIEKQAADLGASLPTLPGEGFARVFVLSHAADAAMAKVERKS